LSVAARAGLGGIFIIALSAHSKGRSHFVVAFLFAIFESIQGLAAGMRFESLVPFVALILGSYVGSKSLKTLAIGIVGLSLSLVLITPVISQIRQLTWAGGYVGSRLSAITQATSIANETNDSESALFDVWGRLDYSPWQEAMMSQYDKGRPGSTYQYILWNLVPRFLYPSKPRLVVGTDIGHAIQGVDQHSSFAGTAYGEMYWNGGWSSVIISSAVYGAILGAITISNLWLFAQNDWVALLIGIYGIIYGFAVDTHFSVNIVGQAIAFLLFLFLYRYISPLLSSRFRR
jgi:hypothetical protein